ncbi:MAG: alpha/beta hydrolase [Saprospirales bacterium]|nr:alpha/beta hydrolase [Saprospirales bacterium]MBK8490509.1 alpha/beta hydrolase [Saprospirales bacterium]
MKICFGCLAIWACCLQFAAAQKPVQPGQPDQGPGGSAYFHEEVRFIDSAQIAGGYWIFIPDSPQPDTAGVVVFLHGFGCFNPMIYGKWISHLVRKGNVVIMPRYQERLWRPRARDFTDRAASGIRGALACLEKETGITVQVEKIVFIGHSYGGVLAANLALQYESWNIPKPAALLLCQPGTNFFPGGLLPEYRDFPADLKLLVVIAKNDMLVGRQFSKQICRAATGLPDRDILLLSPDRHGRPPLVAGHRACHATDPAFDNGVRTFSARYALFHIPTDADDYYVFWKLADALIDCTRYGAHCESAFGGAEAQLSLGVWSDGVPVRPLRILVTR